MDTHIFLKKLTEYQVDVQCKDVTIEELNNHKSVLEEEMILVEKLIGIFNKFDVYNAKYKSNNLLGIKRMKDLTELEKMNITEGIVLETVKTAIESKRSALLVNGIKISIRELKFNSNSILTFSSQFGKISLDKELFMISISSGSILEQLYSTNDKLLETLALIFNIKCN